jgi:hypothetical protein
MLEVHSLIRRMTRRQTPGGDAVASTVVKD